VLIVYLSDSGVYRSRIFGNYTLWVHQTGNPGKNGLRRLCTVSSIAKEKYCVANEVLVLEKKKKILYYYYGTTSTLEYYRIASLPLWGPHGQL